MVVQEPPSAAWEKQHTAGALRGVGRVCAPGTPTHTIHLSMAFSFLKVKAMQQSCLKKGKGENRAFFCQVLKQEGDKGKENTKGETTGLL